MKTLVAILSLLVAGCVGFTTISEESHGRDDFTLERERGQLGFKFGTHPVVSKQDVLNTWGPPDYEITTEHNCDVWGYHRELAFSGVIVWALVVPIPLLVPTGHRDTLIYFEGETATAAIEKYGSEKGFGCGVADTAECVNDFKQPNQRFQPTHSRCALVRG